MTRHQMKHWFVQRLRDLSRLSVMGLVVLIVYLSLYAHYRAARAIEDEQMLDNFNGKVLVQIDQRVGPMENPQAFLDDYKGTLWSMRLAGYDIADPLAAAEMAATSRSFHPPLWLSILVPVVVSLLLGRVFCSWMCPAGLLFEWTDKLRTLLRLAEIKPGEVKFSHRNKYIVLVVGLLTAAVIGLPIFALIYPPAVISRAVHAWVFGTAFGGMLILLGALVAIEVFVSPRWWCRTMCPGGAIYGLLGWARVVRVKLAANKCTGCRDCEPACPMGLNPVLESTGIECDNCGLCLRYCGDDALLYQLGLPDKKRDGSRLKQSARIPRKTTTAALVGVLVLLMPGSALGHHILGLPHYSYKENYPQVPTLEYPATTGPYDVLMTSYPGQPNPGESANLAFYVKNRNTDAPYDQPVHVRVLQTYTFGSNRTIVDSTQLDSFDRTHKLSVIFPEDGEFIVELTMQVEGQTEVIPFLMVAGEPSATWSVLAAVGGGLVVFFVVVRAIKIKRRRRAHQTTPEDEPTTAPKPA